MSRCDHSERKRPHSTPHAVLNGQQRNLDTLARPLGHLPYIGEVILVDPENEDGPSKRYFVVGYGEIWVCPGRNPQTGESYHDWQIYRDVYVFDHAVLWEQEVQRRLAIKVRAEWAHLADPRGPDHPDRIAMTHANMERERWRPTVAFALSYGRSTTS